MPALDVDLPGVSAVDAFRKLLDALVEDGAKVKDEGIEPVLTNADFPELSSRISNALPQIDGDDKTRQFAIIEGAARDLFDTLIATIPIESPDFVKMWNFLDVLSILSDDGHSDPALFFWLAEELLDSQTIGGCRIIFDYLESRRERITAKYFNQKKLVILRACNELLRRLSRAEDTAFCGRVFIFMFQCFPLGDRSSVNLRGEYHVENLTTYETEPADTSMDVDEPKTEDATKETADDTEKPKDKDEKRIDPEALYPLFWSLQNTFSQPLNLLDESHFTTFKSSLEATMKTFETLQEDSQRTLKRKRDDEAVPDAFNPKYLTSKDLFELEISDLSFRRHVLVQALIVTDFLLSLSAGAKEKLSRVNASNKAVIYQGQLNEENTKWATDMKARISDYLRKGLDGPYFNRMVETVLARDKNWVFWKMASCPPIQIDPVSTSGFLEAKSSAQRMATSKRLRQTPMGAVSMDFLKDQQDHTAAMKELQTPSRYQLPELSSFERGIADDDFEISMPTNNDTQAQAVAGKASKSWRALRIAARNKLAAFDRIDDPKNISIVFQDHIEDDDEAAAEEAAAPAEDMPTDQSPIILIAAAPSITSKLMSLHPGVFGLVVRHATREPLDGETPNQTYHFVKAQEFNQLRDGDRLIEHGTRDGVDYGTSSKAVEAVVESGKVPLIELDAEAAQFAKDMDFEARYLAINPEENKEDFTTVKGDDDDRIAEEISALVYGKEKNGESAVGEEGESKDGDKDDAEEDENGEEENEGEDDDEAEEKKDEEDDGEDDEEGDDANMADA